MNVLTYKLLRRAKSPWLRHVIERVEAAVITIIIACVVVFTPIYATWAPATHSVLGYV